MGLIRVESKSPLAVGPGERSDPKATSPEESGEGLQGTDRKKGVVRRRKGVVILRGGVEEKRGSVEGQLEGRSLGDTSFSIHKSRAEVVPFKGRGGSSGITLPATLRPEPVVMLRRRGA